MYFKGKYFYLLGFVLCLSCHKSEKECKAPSPKENIVGTWSASFVSDPEKVSIVNFSSDGFYSEESSMFMGSYFSPVGSWDVFGDTIRIVAKYSNSATSEYRFVLAENACNNMLLEMEGLEKVKMIRK